MFEFHWWIGLLIGVLITLACPLNTAMAQDALYGTAIAAIAVPNQIVVAADSKVSSVNNDGSIKDEGLKCKIYQLGNMFFAAAHGLDKNQETNFNVESILKKASQRKGTILDKINECKNQLTNPLGEALQEIKKEQPIGYKHLCAQTNQLGVVFFGSDKGKLFFHYLDYKVIDPESDDIKVAITLNKNCVVKESMDVLVSPITEDTVSFRKKHPRSGYPKSDLIKLTSNFVQDEIVRDPAEIGPPINIIRVTKNKAECVNPDTICPPIRK